MSATIYRLSSDHWPWAWALEFDYSPEMVEALKRHIPSRDRKWVPTAKQWYFKQGQIEAVEALALAYCGSFVHAERSAPPAAVVTARG